jgi:hypothetical protein
MATWKIKDLRERLAEKYPQEDFEQARGLLASLDWKIRAEKYHVRIAEQAFQEHFGGSSISPEKAIELALTNNDDGAKFTYSQCVREFNLVAAVSVSNTTLELFSQLIAVLFIASKIDDSEVTTDKVLHLLPDGDLKTKLEEIKQSEEYNYIRAFTNMSKHIRQVIPECYISFEESEHHGVRFKTFKYRKKVYLTKRDDEVLEYLRVTRQRFVDLGSLISDLVD